ncbi:hypothetical protein [Kitasatospora sp. NBC_01302]|uniref:hypothetical protein n=1 Tax=Kitasatospora sp. NBC_01302 TaxID=2903575 RepID=UPI002E10A25D|nr:hypothetical protein OG294_00195 [Kitasatospora sp. NBC_01302]
MLRGLAAAEDYPEARQWGDRLFDLVFHSRSGSYLLPAAPVVPLLVRLSCSERAGVQAVALGFLVHLGTSERSRAERCSAGEDLERRVSAAVQAGMPTYYAQLEAHDAWVRSAAFVLITVLEHAALLRFTLAAVSAGLTLPWSSGVVEGHVDRINMINARCTAGPVLGLLRKRVLLAS